MKQILIDKKNCIACALCTTKTNRIISDREGKAEVINQGLIEEQDLTLLLEVIEDCPAKAILLADYISQNEISSFQGLIYYINNEVRNYKVKEPVEADYVFPYIRNAYPSFLGDLLSSKCNGQLYKTESKALAAGKEEFYINVTKNMRLIIRDLLSNYKTGVLNRYRVFEEKEGNYYYDTILEAERKLQECRNEYRVLSGISLSEELCHIKTRAIWRNDTNNKNCALDYLEDRLINKALENGEPAHWYEIWINVTDGGSYWSVDISDANYKFAEHIWESLKKATSPREIITIINLTTEAFRRDLEKEMEEKSVHLLDQMRKYNQEFDRLFISKNDWYEDEINKWKEKKSKLKNQLIESKNYEQLRKLIYTGDLAKENVKPYDHKSHYMIIINLGDRNGKVVKEGEIILSLAEGIHINCLAMNTGASQPYGCGKITRLKNKYDIIAEEDGIVYLFSNCLGLNEDGAIGVIAHPEDNPSEVKEWFMNITEKNPYIITYKEY